MIARVHLAFGSLAERAWLNTAHQGPLPAPAVQAATEALAMKMAPHRLVDSAFTDVPERLRTLLARLINASADQIALGNSTSYGLHLLANGIRWQPDDEVLVVEGDFPATILPWLALESLGVSVRMMQAESSVPRPDELREEITERTRIFCCSWVNSFTGYAANLDGLGAVCREAGVRFVVNGSQALGARVVDVQSTPIDAVACCGYKWLCGPYGTGFCWVRSDLLASLDSHQRYWLTLQQGRSLDDMRSLRPRDDLGVRGLDVFGTANFLNFMPWSAAVEYLLEVGPADIARHNHALVARLIAGLDRERYRLTSPEDAPARSTLVVLSHRDPAQNAGVFQRLKDVGIDIALREGNLRVSPHFFNTRAQIDRVLEVL